MAVVLSVRLKGGGSIVSSPLPTLFPAPQPDTPAKTLAAAIKAMHVKRSDGTYYDGRLDIVLGWHNIGGPGISILDPAMRVTRRKVHKLRLYDCSLGNVGAGTILGCITEAVSCKNSLESLDLGKNKLSELPTVYDPKLRLPTLTALDLSGNELAVMEATWIHLFSHLKSLNLRHNVLGNKGLLELLEQIGKTDVVQTIDDLDVSSNKIHKVPKMINFRAFQSLRKLDLSDNGLEGVPGNVFVLPALRILILKNNKIDDGGCEDIFYGMAAVGADWALNYLDLSENVIKTLPEEGFYERNPLERLDLSNNFIDHLPEGLVRFPNLKEFCFGFNAGNFAGPLVIQGREEVKGFLVHRQIVMKQDARVLEEHLTTDNTTGNPTSHQGLYRPRRVSEDWDSWVAHDTGFYCRA